MISALGEVPIVDGEVANYNVLKYLEKAAATGIHGGDLAEPNRGPSPTPIRGRRSGSDLGPNPGQITGPSRSSRSRTTTLSSAELTLM